MAAKLFLRAFAISCSIVYSLSLGYNILGPALPKRAFISVWNAPTMKCQTKWNVSLNLSSFDIVVNNNQKFEGEYMNIFNAHALGLWPYFDDDGNTINGGLPQLGNMTAHFEKAAKDIVMVIPDPDFQGIAVIDWEKWRPVFDRNWDSKSIYRDKSIALVRQQHPSWSDKEIDSEARKEFEVAAQNYMEGTIMLAQNIRPKALWGYYGFPRCYNVKGPTYKCSNLTTEQNNQISWLFQSSSIILPSIYLTARKTFNVSEFSRYNVLEGFRVGKDAEGYTLPVFPYVRIVYALTEIFLNKEDMFSTIVQSAELGSAGVIIWGSSSDVRTKEFCVQLRNYLDEFIGPLIKSITNIAQECSIKYCNLHGRCRFELDPVVKYDEQMIRNLNNSWQFVKCMCFNGWTGTHCENPSNY